MLYDATPPLKIILNNWVTEKMKTLNFIDPETAKKGPAKWQNLIEIFEEEQATSVKLTKLTYSTMFPTNFEK